MSRELDILQLADYYEKITFRDAEAYLIINKKIEKYNCLFGFISFPNDFETAKIVVELKSEIENVREQIQNIE